MLLFPARYGFPSLRDQRIVDMSQCEWVRLNDLLHMTRKNSNQLFYHYGVLHPEYAGQHVLMTNGEDIVRPHFEKPIKDEWYVLAEWAERVIDVSFRGYHHVSMDFLRPSEIGYAEAIAAGNIVLVMPNYMNQPDKTQVFYGY